MSPFLKWKRHPRFIVSRVVVRGATCDVTSDAGVLSLRRECSVNGVLSAPDSDQNWEFRLAL